MQSVHYYLYVTTHYKQAWEGGGWGGCNENLLRRLSLKVVKYIMVDVEQLFIRHKEQIILYFSSFVHGDISYLGHNNMLKPWYILFVLYIYLVRCHINTRSNFLRWPSVEFEN